MAAKKAQFLASLREERGVAEPHQGAVSLNNSPSETIRSTPALPTGDAAGQTPAAGPSMEELLKTYDARRSEAEGFAKQAAEREASAVAREAAAKAREDELLGAARDPIEFLSKIEWTEDQWRDFLAGGGKPDPVKDELKSMREQLKAESAKREALEKSLSDREVNARRAQEDAQIVQSTQKLPFSKSLSNPAMVRQRMGELKAKNQPATADHALQSLESEFKTGLMSLLQNPEIAAMLGSSVNKPNSNQAAASPRTLNSNFASSSPTSDTSRPKPMDWKAKKALFLAELARSRRAQ